MYVKGIEGICIKVQECTDREAKRAVQEVSIYGLRDESVWIEVGKTTSKKRDRKPRTSHGDPHRSWPRRVLPQLNLA